MLGGLGHTSLVGSKPNLRGPISGAGSLFFFLSAIAENGNARPSASSSSTASGLQVRLESKRVQNIGVSGHFPGGLISFILIRFLWQLSQNAMLLDWSFTSRPGSADACDWW